MTERKWHLMYADVKEKGQRVIDVNYPNGAHMGEMFQDVDGYFKWWPRASGGGFIESWVMRELSDKLDDLNREWDAMVKRDAGIGDADACSVQPTEAPSFDRWAAGYFSWSDTPPTNAEVEIARDAFTDAVNATKRALGVPEGLKR